VANMCKGSLLLHIAEFFCTCVFDGSSGYDIGVTNSFITKGQIVSMFIFAVLSLKQITNYDKSFKYARYKPVCC
jgi:hypothetical protein